ncbi:hypothetical protein [Chitinimonas taiwanensis]|uniref:Uncharacterized protein n=1 Tax=Chitinimonas taiwanensis DSM 18899 TaxID=1121279 RepID=A0A1K2HPL3_9NEIS|nr:hypothetical protein [Chitinimonas taiwanensis]SFZ78710.1 hypothetical protein SAMN02745887_03143 [Chitinimonas taiwanensis DSM 18899]
MPIDYAAFRYEAVFDFIELDIQLHRASNHQTVSKALGASYVIPLDPHSGGPLIKNEAGHYPNGGSTNRFGVRIQDPASQRDVQARLRPLEESHGIAHPVGIRVLEVAFDAYAPPDAQHSLVDMAFHFNRGLAPRVSNDLEFNFFTAIRKKVGNDGVADLRFPMERFETERQVKQLLQQGRTIKIGENGSGHTQRIYVKTSDTAPDLSDGRVPLPASQHRARFENTFSGSKLPFTLLDDMVSDSFVEKLSPFFAWRLVPQESPLTLRQLTIGARELRPRISNGRVKGTREFSRNTRADDALNRRAYDALRALSKRWRLG